MFFQKFKLQKGFTLVELLIFTSIFTVVSVAFIGIFVVITRIQSRESASIGVSQESQFVLQTIQRLVQDSSLIEMDPNVATTTLKLRMPTVVNDPTYIYVSDGQLFLRETATGTPQALTSRRVVLPSLSFTKRSNPGGKDAVDILFTMQVRASTTQQVFSQAIQTSVARVSAASFDSSLNASGTNLAIGSVANEWKSINNTIFFSGSNVGINTTQFTPTQSLEVRNGGFRLTNESGIATSSLVCDSATNRGTLWFVKGSGSARDTMVVCGQTGSSTYQWMPLN